MKNTNYLGDDITEEQFMEVYNSHPENKWIKFAVKYFSSNNKQEDKWVGKISEGFLMFLFILSFIGILLEFNKIPLLIIIGLFIASTVGLGILIFGAIIMNNLRIRKICKKLSISRLEYFLLSSFYLR
jgi:hypothetical protein